MNIKSKNTLQLSANSGRSFGTSVREAISICVLLHCDAELEIDGVTLSLNGLSDPQRCMDTFYNKVFAPIPIIP